MFLFSILFAVQSVLLSKITYFFPLSLICAVETYLKSLVALVLILLFSLIAIMNFFLG